MSAPELSHTHYDRGCQLYREGASIRDLFAESVKSQADEEAAAEAHRASKSPERFNYNNNAIPSLMMGFLEGALGDLRRAIGGRGLRA